MELVSQTNSDDHTRKEEQCCILHVDYSFTNEDVKSFDYETWTKVRKACEKRRSRPNWTQSKYSHICVSLPNSFSHSHGYHTACYKNFTAIADTEPSQVQCSSSSSSVLLRSRVDHPVAGSTEKFQETCLFCGRKEIRRKRQLAERLGYCENRDVESNIKESAKALNDHEMVTKIGSVDFIAKEVMYHHTCRKQYVDKAEREKKNKSTVTNVSEYSANLKARDQAFNKMKEYINLHLISQNKAEMLTSLHAHYMNLLTELNCYTDNLNAHFFGQKLLKHYPEQLRIGKLNNKQGNIVYPSTLKESEAVTAVIHSSMDSKLADVALHLRAMIIDIKNNSEEFAYPLTAEALMKGQAKPPDLLTRFLCIMFTGSANEPDERVKRYVNSVSDDCLFACTKGYVKPAKHVCLGLGLKSLTGSRRVIEILNHFGHCLSYHTIESLETDLAMSVSEKGHVTPDGILKKPGLSTGLAWDNYDEMNETLSGSGTLHDTVGICYQNVKDEAVEIEVESVRPEKCIKRKRSRTFEILEDRDLEPYRKKPRISSFQYNIKSRNTPERLSQVKRQDQIWTFLCHIFPKTPMWTGWNSLVTDDTLPLQTVGYMENLALPPTRLDVVAETLRVSQKVAEECQEDYAVVHYDLAIAKPAKQIQQQESPKYDNIFICFGPFHIQMAYFGSLGYIIDESGGPHILTDTEVLASGSLNGFILGKHYNRCKRLHPLLCQAFKILHLRAFLQDKGNFSDEVKLVLEQLYNSPSVEAIDRIGNSEEFVAFMNSYEEYTQQTRIGQHGRTAQYWIIYTDLVQLYLLFSRSCHTNDLELFIYCIGKMAAVFFATSRPNYARWMVRYHLDLLNIDETHPGVRQVLEAGALTVRRTPKSFSRCPVDLTLEQTINADAASRLTGISSFSTLIGARRRWMLTQAARRSVVCSLLSKAGINNNPDPVQDLKPYRIDKDNSDLQKLISGIENKMNPFHVDYRNENLYCLSTGKIMSQDIADDLTALERKGDIWMNEFRQGCFADASRFEKPIKRRKVMNFADSAVKMKIVSKDRTILQLRGTRDLFGRLLYLATVKDIDLKKIFSFPLTPVPMSLSHIDGTMMKTDKSKLMKHLESKITSERPATKEVTIVDGMFLIQSLTNLPSTFGEVAKSILAKLSHLSKRVDFVCDTYTHPSIKDVERKLRGNVVAEMTVSGPDQRRPKEFHKALQSESFKTSLLSFLADEWTKAAYASILKDCELYFGIDNKCFSFTSDHAKVTRTSVDALACIHQEADTRIVWHLQQIVQTIYDPNVVIRCTDTDVLIILLSFVGKTRIKVWMDVGHDSLNNRRYIDINKLSLKLGNEMCAALPAIHAFSGCDYTAAFARKGKVRPFSIAEKSDRYIKAFARMGEHAEVTHDTEIDIESFVCTLYGKPAISEVSDARYAIFRTKFAPTDGKHPLDKIKGADASSLPPSKPVLHEKLLRTNLVAYLWRHADQSVPLEMNPLDCGWYVNEGHFDIKWFSGPQIPADIDLVIDGIDNDTDETEELDIVAEDDDDSDDTDVDENNNSC